MSAPIDLSGRAFGRLTVLSRGENNNNGRCRWRCRCNCGQEAVVDGKHLRDGHTQSCGCLHREKNVKTIDIAGKTFGRLTVISRAANTAACQARWNCRCECGNIKVVTGNNLKSGCTKSCGCLHRDRIATHGQSQSAEFGSWQGIIQRCTNPRCTHFKIYGGRGIKVCARWAASFEDFFADMGDMPSPKHTIERVDNDGDYEPGNCRWATRYEQAQNRRTCRIIEFNGERLTIAEWCRRLGLAYTTVRWRLDQGWEIAKALSK